MNDVINSIPKYLKLSLAKLLDRRKKPNWKSLVEKTPKDVYAFKQGEYETLRLEILKENGSPTLALIEKLGLKNVQICHFINILENLEPDENVNKALDLFMGEPPSIVVQRPAEIQLTVGDDVIVRCDAVGKQPMLYQWFKEGDELKDATSNELTLTKVQPVNEGLYICRVANVRGYQFSRWFRVVVGKQTKIENEKGKVEIVKNTEQPLDRVAVDREPSVDVITGSDTTGSEEPEQKRRKLNRLSRTPDNCHQRESSSPEDKMCKSCTNEDLLPIDRNKWPIDKIELGTFERICKLLDMADKSKEPLTSALGGFDQTYAACIETKYKGEGGIGTAKEVLGRWGTSSHEKNNIGAFKKILEDIMQRSDVLKVIAKWEKTPVCHGCGIIY